MQQEELLDSLRRITQIIAVHFDQNDAERDRQTRYFEMLQERQALAERLEAMTGEPQARYGTLPSTIQLHQLVMDHVQLPPDQL